MNTFKEDREHQTVHAPRKLTSETRVDFRTRALEAVEHAARSGARTVDIDLGDTEEVDASGLGALILVHKRAREKRLGVSISRVSKEVRVLLNTTKLDELFDIAD